LNVIAKAVILARQAANDLKKMDHISSFFASSVSGQVSSTYVFTSITLLVIGAIALLQWSTPDPREPPVLPPKFPLIGHVIGMVKHEVEYYRLLR